MIKRILALTVAVVASLAMFIPASSAATHAKPGLVATPAGVSYQNGKRVTWWHICAHTNTSLCLVGHGAGNQVTVQSSGYFKWQSIPDGGQIEWQDGANNCLKAQSNGVVTITGAVCDGGASKDWNVGGSGNVTFYSSYAAGYMGLNGAPTNGSDVFTGVAQTGFFYGWQTPTCCLKQ